MTIASTQSKIIYAGNGSTAAFAIPFMFIKNEDIEVTLIDSEGEHLKVIGTDYLLTGERESNGGICTMNRAPVADETLVIRRNPALVQEVDYVENDAFPAATHEAALDKLTMICQSLSERLDRTITFRVSSAVTGVELPEPTAGQILTWNESGDNLENRQLEGVESLFIPLEVDKGGTGAETIEDAQTNLGFGSIARAVAVASNVDDAQTALGLDSISRALSTTTTTTEAQAVLDAEPADTEILKADLPDQIKTVFGEEAQVHSGNGTSSISITRNHIVWSLTQNSTLHDMSMPWDGTYVFHVYPNGHALTVSANYKMNMDNPPDFLSDAGEIRITIEQFNGRKSIASVANLEA